MVAVLSDVDAWPDVVALALGCVVAAGWMELSRRTQRTGYGSLAALASFAVLVVGLIGFSGAASPPGGPLADWLTSAATQEKTFVNAGQYPSVIEAQSSPAIVDSANAYFNDAPTGTIFGERSEAVTVNTYKSVDFIKYNQALQDAITRVFQGLEDQQTAWDTYVAEVEAF